MTPIWFVLAAATGAVGRHLIGRVVCSWQALLVANTAASALLGWLVSRDVGPETVTIIGIGLCGSLSTFSSFALVARRLGATLGTAYAASTLVCVTAAASVATSL